MIENAYKLLNDLNDQLKFIDLEQDDPIKCAQLSIDVSRKAVEKLKNIILKHKFKSQGEEIKFFKETKPKFLAPLIYHLKVYKIELPSKCQVFCTKYLTNTWLGVFKIM